jgi:hypothetical protein
MDPARARDVRTHYPELVNSNKVTIELVPDGEVPEWMAVMVQTNDQRQAGAPCQPAFSLLEQSAKWLPFSIDFCQLVVVLSRWSVSAGLC